MSLVCLIATNHGLYKEIAAQEEGLYESSFIGFVVG